MPHAPGHGPSFEFPRPWQMASQAMPGFMSPEQYGQIGRGLLDFTPVVGTALNWNEMGPWERALSVGLDVADVATFGGGKAVTAPIKTTSKAIQKFMMRNDPKLTYVRAGMPPPAEVPPADRVADYKPNELIVKLFAEGRGKELPKGILGRSAIWTTDPPGMEPGISTYQALEYPGGRGFPGFADAGPEAQYIIRNQPDEQLMLQQWTPQGQQRWHNPFSTQKAVMGAVETGDTPMYKYSDMDIMDVLGSDVEALIDPAKGIGRIEAIDPGDIWRQQHWSPGREKSYISSQFEKYDQFGNVIPYDIARWADRANLPSTIPATVPSRGFDWSEGDFAWNAPGLFGGAEIDTPIQRAEGEGKILSLGALP
jgi:hypothetical protein